MNSQKLTWTNYSVWFLLILGVIYIPLYGGTYTDHPHPLLASLVFVGVNIILFALFYRFFSKIEEAYKLKGTVVTASRWMTNLIVASIIIGTPQVFIESDFDLLVEHISTFQVLKYAGGVLTLIIWSLGAGIGWNYYKIFKGQNDKLRKLGMIVLIYSTLGILSALGSFEGVDLQELEKIKYPINQFYEILLLSVLIGSIPVIWICLWPIRIMVKILRNDDFNFRSFDCSSSNAQGNKPSAYTPNSGSLSEKDESKGWFSAKELFITGVLSAAVVAVAFLFFNGDIASDDTSEESDVMEYSFEFNNNETEFQETDLVKFILSSKSQNIGGLNVYYFRGYFKYDQTNAPIMLAFCENPDNIGHICGVAYRNMTSDTVLDMDGLFSPSEITLKSLEGSKIFEITLSNTITDGNFTYVSGTAIYGDIQSIVQIWSTDETFTLPESIKKLGNQTLPDWVSTSVLEGFGKSDLTMKPYEWMRDNLFRGMAVGLDETGLFEGSINSLPVVLGMRVNFDGTVTGRYAYTNDLRERGDEESCWSKFHGQVLLDSSDYPYVLLETKKSEGNKVHEYILLQHKLGDSWDGKLFDANELNNDGKPKLLEVSISPKQ